MGLVQRVVSHPPARPQPGFCNGLCRLAIAINIFLVPVALASIGFGAFVALLSLPLFAYGLIANRVRLFESSAISLEALQPPS